MCGNIIQTKRRVGNGRRAASRGGSLRGHLWLLALAPLLLTGPSGSASAETTFEAVQSVATPAPDVDALIAPYLDDCESARREIDRARCRGAQTFLRTKLGKETFVTTVDSPNVVSVSDYDSAVRGYRLRVVGCLTCEDPADGPSAEKRFVTLKVPAKDAETMGIGSAIAHPAIAFENPEQAKAWLATVKPNLRAQFVFRPEGTSWSYRNYRGVAFTPMATRIFDRCTGEVVYSSPPSQAKVPVQAGLDGCGSSKAVAAASKEDISKDKEGIDELPEKLGALEIGEALHDARSQISACNTEFKMRGTVDLEFEVAGTGGSAQGVRAKGPLGGTDVAQCLLQAVRSVQFPRFQQAHQVFKYPVLLNGN